MALMSSLSFKIRLVAECNLLASDNVPSRKTCNDLSLGKWNLGVRYTRMVEA